jgi:hypothetical protein
MCDHIKWLIALTSDRIKRLFLLFLLKASTHVVVTLKTHNNSFHSSKRKNLTKYFFPAGNLKSAASSFSTAISTSSWSVTWQRRPRHWPHFIYPTTGSWRPTTLKCFKSRYWEYKIVLWPGFRTDTDSGMSDHLGVILFPYRFSNR